MLVLPYVFKGRIENIVKQEISENTEFNVDFRSAGISFFKEFPKLSIYVSDLHVTGKADFENVTILSAKELLASLDLAGDSICISKIIIDNPYIYATVLPDGKTNWTMSSDSSASSKNIGGGDVHTDIKVRSDMNLQLKDLSIKNAKIVYDDRASDMKAVVDGLNVSASGNLYKSVTEIKNKMSIAALSFEKGGVKYLNNAEVSVNLDVSADFEKNEFIIRKNKISLNKITFYADGSLRARDTSIYADVKIMAEKTSLKDLLSLVPFVYSNNFSKLKTTGNVSFGVNINGLFGRNVYPGFDASLVVADGVVKYDKMPGAIKDINIKAAASSPGGSLDNIKVDVSEFHFNMEGNSFDAGIKITTPLSDPDFNAKIKGVIDLESVKDVYPLEKKTAISGLLKADVSLGGKVSYLKHKKYSKFITNGQINIEKLNFKSAELPYDLDIKNCAVVLSSNRILLKNSYVLLGDNDIRADGLLKNVLPWFFSDDVLYGNLNILSENLNLNDFMSGDISREKQKAEGSAAIDSSVSSVLDIPQNIDFKVTARLNKVKYDKLILENNYARLFIKDKKFSIKNLSADALGGSIHLDGFYTSVNPEKPLMDLDLNMDSVYFGKMFTSFSIVKNLAPFFKDMEGKANLDAKVKFLLDRNMDPVMKTVNGSGVIVTKDVAFGNSAIVNSVAKMLGYGDVKNIKPGNTKVRFNIRNGKLTVLPMDEGSSVKDAADSVVKRFSSEKDAEKIKKDGEKLLKAAKKIFKF